MDYRGWAMLSALFAGLTAVLAKKGVDQVPPNLALAIRVVVVTAFAIGVTVYTKQTNLGNVNGRAWFYLTASGFATGLSWLCYFRALRIGEVAKVAPIDKLSFVIAMVLGIAFLGEKVSTRVGFGAALIVVGVLLTLR